MASEFPDSEEEYELMHAEEFELMNEMGWWKKNDSSN